MESKLFEREVDRFLQTPGIATEEIHTEWRDRMQDLVENRLLDDQDVEFLEAVARETSGVIDERIMGLLLWYVALAPSRRGIHSPDGLSYSWREIVERIGVGAESRELLAELAREPDTIIALHQHLYLFDDPESQAAIVSLIRDAAEAT